MVQGLRWLSTFLLVPVKQQPYLIKSELVSGSLETLSTINTCNHLIVYMLMFIQCGSYYTAAEHSVNRSSIREQLYL